MGLVGYMFFVVVVIVVVDMGLLGCWVLGVGCGM